MIVEVKKFGETLVSRDLARSVFTDMDISDSRLELDFKGVLTVTPSFSHEMIVTILEKKVASEVDFLNTNSSIKLQLQKALASVDADERGKIKIVAS